MLVSSGAGVNDLMALAAEIADTEEIALKEALKRAAAWWPFLEQDATQDVRYRLTPEARNALREERAA